MKRSGKNLEIIGLSLINVSILLTGETKYTPFNISSGDIILKNNDIIIKYIFIFDIYF